MTFMPFVWELHGYGEQPKHVGERKGKIYVLIQYVHMLVLRDCKYSLYLNDHENPALRITRV